MNTSHLDAAKHHSHHTTIFIEDQGSRIPLLREWHVSQTSYGPFICDLDDLLPIDNLSSNLRWILLCEHVIPYRARFPSLKSSRYPPNVPDPSVKPHGACLLTWNVESWADWLTGPGMSSPLLFSRLPLVGQNHLVP